ncbi:MAG: hypothetical protein M3Z09_12160 [Acidobacteriota bacterium]|nr:hypothetical protein [Acidobacteriota bacterium]
MFRFIFQFIALLIFFAVARRVLTWVLKLVMTTARTNAQTPFREPEPSANGALHSAGELHQDPVCGTFVPGSSTWKRTVGGREVYFCSSNCRDQFLVSTRG